LSVLLVAAGLFYTNAANRAQQELTERGQVTDRISKAVDQVGSDKLDVRLGGMYALERLMRESPGDQPNLVAVLCAYVRLHATASPAGRASPAAAEPLGPRAFVRPGLATDVQTALTIVARRPRSGEHEEIDLSGADLSGAQLYSAKLAGANLVEANLSGAMLIQADLSKAGLIGADLSRAELAYSDLRDAILFDTNLTDANLYHANLADADLGRALGLTTSQAKCADFNERTLFPGVIKWPVPGHDDQDFGCVRVVVVSPPR